MVAKYQGITVTKYQANYQGMSCGNVLVVTKIMFFCNISETIYVVNRYVTPIVLKISSVAM